MPLTQDQADRNRFRRQWALLPAGDVPLEGMGGLSGWTQTALGDRVLCTHPDVHAVSKVIDGCTMVVLGIAYDTAQRVVASDPDSVPANATTDAVVKWVRGLSGVYAVIAQTTDRGVLVLADPGGIMGVYTDGEIVASTPALWSVLKGDQDQPHELTPPYPLSETNDWFTGDATQYTGIRSLFANHLLEITTGSIERYWSTTEPSRLDAREAIERVADEFRGAVQAATAAYPCLLSITGGRDSRVYAAACGGGEGRAFTIVRGNAGVRDAEIAQQICQCIGLEHELLTAGPVPEWLDRLYDGMTEGMVPPHRRQILEACARLASPDAVHINGNLGGLSKAFYWASGKPASVSAGDLVRDFIGVRTEAERGVRRWLDTTGSLPPHRLQPDVPRATRFPLDGARRDRLVGSSTSRSRRSRRGRFSTVTTVVLSPISLSGRFLIDLVQELNPALARIPYASGTSRLLRMIPKPVKVAVKKWIKK